MANENRHTEIFDTREDGLKCVRFESGQVGVVDERGEVVYQIDKCRHIEFAEHDFLKLKFGMAEILGNPTLKNAPSDDESYLRSIFYVDMKSGQTYGSMPQILHRKGFELLNVGGFLCTRTRKCYMVKRKPDIIAASPNGLYLPLTCFNLPDDERLNDIFRWYDVYEVCLLKDDDSRVYWLLRVYKDYSVLVMDENGLHTYVWMDWRTGKVSSSKSSSSMYFFKELLLLESFLTIRSLNFRDAFKYTIDFSNSIMSMSCSLRVAFSSSASIRSLWRSIERRAVRKSSALR